MFWWWNLNVCQVCQVCHCPYLCRKQATSGRCWACFWDLGDGLCPGLTAQHDKPRAARALEAVFDVTVTQPSSNGRLAFRFLEENIAGEQSVMSEAQTERFCLWTYWTFLIATCCDCDLFYTMNAYWLIRFCRPRARRPVPTLESRRSPDWNVDFPSSIQSAHLPYAGFRYTFFVDRQDSQSMPRPYEKDTNMKTVNIGNSKDFPWHNEHSWGLAGWHGRCKSLWLGCIAEHFFGIIDFLLVSFDFSILWYFIHLPDYELMLRPKMCWWSFKTSCSCPSRCCSIALT